MNKNKGSHKNKITNLFKNLKKFNFSKTQFYKSLDSLNTNKLLIGLMMIFMNIGSRYIELGLTNGQEMIIKNIAREVLIFTIAFIYTKDLILAIIITGIFVILAKFVFNEKSKYSIMPEKYKRLAKLIDTNNDNIISEEEISKAEQILKQAKTQKSDLQNTILKRENENKKNGKNNKNNINEDNLDDNEIKHQTKIPYLDTLNTMRF
jgi:ABC-type multidrug transport system fused ATPase/permease subunit